MADRKFKRMLRRMGVDDPVYDAFNVGLNDGYHFRSRPWRYPPGRRRTEYERGYRLASAERSDPRLGGAFGR